jgi:hypothetical protein
MTIYDEGEPHPDAILDPSLTLARFLSALGVAPRMWDLNDIASVGDLAARYGVGSPTVSNWAARCADFPKPLRVTSGGKLYSIRQVAQWHEGRDWAHHGPKSRPAKP